MVSSCATFTAELGSFFDWATQIGTSAAVTAVSARCLAIRSAELPRIQPLWVNPTTIVAVAPMIAPMNNGLIQSGLIMRPAICVGPRRSCHGRFTASVCVHAYHCNLQSPMAMTIKTMAMGTATGGISQVFMARILSGLAMSRPNGESSLNRKNTSSAGSVPMRGALIGHWLPGPGGRRRCARKASAAAS